jgi:hypothetical protein
MILSVFVTILSRLLLMIKLESDTDFTYSTEVCEQLQKDSPGYMARGLKTLHRGSACGTLYIADWFIILCV